MKYPTGVAQNDLNKTIKRTIIVKKPDGSTIDASQTVHLTRTSTVDERLPSISMVTGQPHHLTSTRYRLFRVTRQIYKLLTSSI